MTIPQQSSWKSKFLLSVLSLIVVAVILEFSIRTYDMASGRGFFSGHRNLISKGTKPLLPFRTFGFELYKNIDGVKYISSRWGELYPIRKPNGSFRIVVFGGSSSENLPAFRKARIHYPLVLQSILRKALNTDAIEVINVANSGYSTAHSLILFELDVLSWKPDLVIISHNINDLLAAYWPDFAFDYSNKYSSKFYHMPDLESICTTSNMLFQHSQFYWYVREKLNVGVSNESIEIKRRHYDTKSLQLPLEVFKRNLRSFVAIAKENGIRVLLGNQPLQPSEEYFIRHVAYKPYNSIVTYPLHDEFVQHHRAFNNAIKQVAEETQVLFIDNDSALGGKKDYFIDYVHYTPEGVTKLANNYANFLLKNHIVQLSDATSMLTK